VQMLIIVLYFIYYYYYVPLQIMCTSAHLRKPMHNLRSCACANSSDLHTYVVTYSHHTCACAFGYY
jgi:hypothetical protein